MPGIFGSSMDGLGDVAVPASPSTRKSPAETIAFLQRQHAAGHDYENLIAETMHDGPMTRPEAADWLARAGIKPPVPVALYAAGAAGVLLAVHLLKKKRSNPGKRRRR